MGRHRPNQPVDPHALGTALGPDTVNQLAGKTGLDVRTLLPMLAAALPSVINAVTPDGKVPQGNAAAGSTSGRCSAGSSSSDGPAARTANA